MPKYQTDCCKFNLERSTDPNINKLLTECLRFKNRVQLNNNARLSSMNMYNAYLNKGVLGGWLIIQPLRKFN
ncbi:hypothetical protein PA7559_37000 [Pseudoalteromonas distincta]